MNWIKNLSRKKAQKQCTISYAMCSCGKYEKCTREIRVKDGDCFGNTKLYVDSKDHFSCGKVQEQIKQIKNIKTISYTVLRTV